MTSSQRRRERPARLLAATIVLAVAALLVLIALPGQSALGLSLAGVAAVLLGVTATRITYTELVDNHRIAAAERAKVAREYRAIAADQAAATKRFVDQVNERTEQQQAVLVGQADRITRLEKRLAEAAQNLIEARQTAARHREELTAEQRLHEETYRRLGDAEERAAEAVVRLAEIEQELQVALDQLRVQDQIRRHA